MHFYLSFAALALGLCLTAGCRTYAPAPIDWSREASEWNGSATNRIPLTLETARQLALVLNPDINALRLARQSASRKALASGWWEDPSFNLDALRVLRGGAHPWLLGSGLSFTLPVNGVPGIEAKAAQAYAHADALAVTVAERTLLAEVERAWNACRINQHCIAAQHAYKERLLDRERQIRALIAAGELPKAEGDRVAQERIKLDLECLCCGAEAVTQKHTLLRLLGLHPAAPFDIVSDDADGAQPAPPSVIADLDLIRHPRVQEKLARLKATEEDLRAEIRRQYPDIEAGPLWEHEDGGANMGASIGFNLPLWNRNRLGIAEAEGGRDATRLEALNEWRGLVTELHEARAILQVAETKERGMRETLLPEAQASAERTERLFAQGEADVLAVLAADETVYTVQESLLTVQQELAEARIRIDLLRVEKPADNQPLLSGEFDETR